MKKWMIAFSLMLIHFFSNAQSLTMKRSVLTIIQQRSIYLNGGARASVGGKSRTNIKIDLPPNTKSWYYSFTTSPGESGMANLNLAIQLSALALDPTGVSSSIAENVKVPSGSASLDVYLLDQRNNDLFIQKVDLNGGTYNYFREGSIFNTRQGVIEIDEVRQGTFYLGLKNPSTWDGLNAQIEVVAIVEEAEPLTEEQSQGMTLGNLGWKAFERGEYDRCIDMSRKALALYNGLGYVHFNIALSHLIKGEGDIALQEYTKAISVTKKSMVVKQTFEGALQDLNTYMEKFPSQADARDIIEIIKIELQSMP